MKSILDEISDKMPDEFNMAELMGKVPVEERTPYVVVAFQECERMNMLTTEMRQSLKTLNLGLKVSRFATASLQRVRRKMNMASSEM